MTVIKSVKTLLCTSALIIVFFGAKWVFSKQETSPSDKSQQNKNVGIAIQQDSGKIGDIIGTVYGDVMKDSSKKVQNYYYGDSTHQK